MGVASRGAARIPLIFSCFFWNKSRPVWILLPAKGEKLPHEQGEMAIGKYCRLMNIAVLLLMAEILHQLIGSFSHFL